MTVLNVATATSTPDALVDSTYPHFQATDPQNVSVLISPVGRVRATRRQHPGAHVYHYASYEETALKRLASWHATREVEVDNLLNVAVSRAKCLAIVIANPALTAIKCQTPEQMALVNTLCWVAEAGRQI